MRWFTSDTHWGHNNILKLGKGRPFADMDEMREELISRFNARVNPGDTWYHLGDVSFERRIEDTFNILDRLNGQGHLIKGNHDRREIEKWTGWQSVSDLKEISISVNGDKHMVIMCHYPLLTWNRIGHGAWMLHGHCHGNLHVPDEDKIARMDVGVDCHNFAPISEDQVASIMLRRVGYTPPDHHQGYTDNL